jgi:hypothetical protein
MQHRNRWLALGAILACLPISACGQSSQFDSEAASDQGPAKIEPIKGTEFARVTLTKRAAERVGVQTADVLSAHGGQTKIPYASVLYDAAGKTFTYVSPSRLVFLRTPITIDRIAGRVAVLRKGPAAGTKVVTVGSAELLGAEYGVEE